MLSSAWRRSASTRWSRSSAASSRAAAQEIARAVTASPVRDATQHRDARRITAPYYTEAAQLASTHGLDLLELVAGDGTIVSSAEWPARFGYREDWLADRRRLEIPGRFPQREELPDGMTPGAGGGGHRGGGDRKLYVAGGQQLD